MTTAEAIARLDLLIAQLRALNEAFARERQITARYDREIKLNATAAAHAALRTT